MENLTIIILWCVKLFLILPCKLVHLQMQTQKAFFLSACVEENWTSNSLGWSCAHFIQGKQVIWTRSEWKKPLVLNLGKNDSKIEGGHRFNLSNTYSGALSHPRQIYSIHTLGHVTKTIHTASLETHFRCQATTTQTLNWIEGTASDWPVLVTPLVTLKTHQCDFFFWLQSLLLSSIFKTMSFWWAG